MKVESYRIPEEASQAITVVVRDEEKMAMPPGRLDEIKELFPKELPQITRDLLQLAVVSYELSGDIERIDGLESNHE